MCMYVYIVYIPSAVYIYILATKNEQNNLTVVGTRLHPQSKGIKSTSHINIYTIYNVSIYRDV